MSVVESGSSGEDAGRVVVAGGKGKHRTPRVRFRVGLVRYRLGGCSESEFIGRLEGVLRAVGAVVECTPWLARRRVWRGEGDGGAGGVVQGGEMEIQEMLSREGTQEESLGGNGQEVYEYEVLVVLPFAARRVSVALWQMSGAGAGLESPIMEVARAGLTLSGYVRGVLLRWGQELGGVGVEPDSVFIGPGFALLGVDVRQYRVAAYWTVGSEGIRRIGWSG